MNQNNNIYNQKEVENKLHNFQEGKDYFVTPSREPEIKDYTFYNDRLKSLFGGNNWVPVQVWQEKFDGKDVRYRGHFEEGKDYRYSAQHWNYEKDYQGDRGIENMPDWMRPVFVDAKGQITSHSKVEVYGESGNFKTREKYWEGKWIYEGKKNEYEHKLSVKWGNPEPRAIGFGEEKGLIYPSCNNPKHSHSSYRKTFWEEKRDLENKLNYLRDKYGYDSLDKSVTEEIDCLKTQISDLERQIEEEEAGIHPLQQKGRTSRNEEGTLVIGSKGTFVNDKEDSNNFDSEKENYELRQQLASVQAELAKVLVELKKLTGKGDKKLEQQQAENEKAIKQGSVAEIKTQMQKSQALMREAGIQTKENTPEKSEPGNGALPYLAVGSLLAVGLGGVVYWWKKHSSKK